MWNNVYPGCWSSDDFFSMRSRISEGAKLSFEGFGEYWGLCLYPAIFHSLSSLSLSVFMCVYLFLSLVTWFSFSPLWNWCLFHLCCVSPVGFLYLIFLFQKRNDWLISLVSIDKKEWTGTPKSRHLLWCNTCIDFSVWATLPQQERPALLQQRPGPHSPQQLGLVSASSQAFFLIPFDL